MNKKVYVELFRFNEETDYLPYYQKHTLEYGESDTINDLLVKMNEIEAFGFKSNCNLKVNELYINASENVAQMVERCGNEIQINPISELRATKDLLIDRSDFIEKMLLMQEYISAEENINYRKNTELAYYASNTLNYNREYIGDHVLIIAADIIEKRFELKNEILKLLIDEENGIWFHTSLANRMLSNEQEKKIQKVLYLAQEYVKPKSKIAKKLASFCEKKTIRDFEYDETSSVSTVVQRFAGFNIASYNGVIEHGLETLIEQAGATYVEIASKREDLAPHSVIADENFSYKIAGDILMQAKDANADFVVVKNETTKEFFDKNQCKMEKLVGRELGMSVISQNQLVQLVEGEKDSSKLGFDDHKIKVNFL